MISRCIIFHLANHHQYITQYFSTMQNKNIFWSTGYPIISSLGACPPWVNNKSLKLMDFPITTGAGVERMMISLTGMNEGPDSTLLYTYTVHRPGNKVSIRWDLWYFMFAGWCSVACTCPGRVQRSENVAWSDILATNWMRTTLRGKHNGSHLFVLLYLFLQVKRIILIVTFLNKAVCKNSPKKRTINVWCFHHTNAY